MNAKRFLLLVLLLVVLGAGVALGVFAGPHLMPAETKTPAPQAQAAAPTPRVVTASFGRVDLERGTSLLSPAQPGRVVEVLVKENAKVEAGQPLIRLDNRAATAQVDAARAAVLAAEVQLAVAKKAPDRHQVRLAAQQAAVQAAQSRLDAGRQLLTSKQQQVREGLINQREVPLAEDQVKELTALKQVESNRLSELEMNEPAQEVRRAEADLSRATAQLRLAQEALDQCTLRAPGAGTVIRLMVTPGEVIGGVPRQQVVLFAPDEPWIIRAEVEQEFASKVAVGQAVEMHDEVGPDNTFTGKVTRLSSWYLQRRETVRDPTRYSDANTLECIITPDPGHPQLRLGQRLSVLFLPITPPSKKEKP